VSEIIGNTRDVVGDKNTFDSVISESKMKSNITAVVNKTYSTYTINNVFEGYVFF
jgi:hypothetical protein